MKTILQKDRFHSAAQLVDSLEDRFRQRRWREHLG
jgi:hypothetical protein